MCLGGSDPSKGIKKQQQIQQNRIDQGMEQLNAIFFGGTVPQFTQAQGPFDPNKDYFREKLGAMVPFNQEQKPGYDPGGAFAGRDHPPTGSLSTNLFLSLGKFFGGDDPITGKQLQKRGKLFEAGTPKTYEGFTPEFFKGAQQRYLNFALPQLGEQAREQGRQLRFNLARRGQLGSTAERELGNKFQDEVSRQKINLANQGLGVSQDLQRDVMQQYNQLVNQLQLSNDPSAVTQSALQTAAAFSQPSAMPAIGNLFQNFANTYLAGRNYGMYDRFTNEYVNQLRQAGGFPSAPTSLNVR